MAIEIRTRGFELSHGRRPSGDGQWAFAEHPRETDMGKMVWFHGKWGDARRSAIAWCRSRQIERLFLMP